MNPNQCSGLLVTAIDWKMQPEQRPVFEEPSWADYCCVVSRPYEISVWGINYAVSHKGLMFSGALWAGHIKLGVIVLHTKPGIDMDLSKKKIKSAKRREPRKGKYLIFKSQRRSS